LFFDYFDSKNEKNKQRKQSGGKKPLLTEEQLQKLAKELESKPSDGGIWTGTKVGNSLGMGLSKKVQILMAESSTEA
jgi:transposase